jgi:hypothetical protein
LVFGVGSRIPVICGVLESSARYEFEKIFRILLPHSSRSQFRLKIGSKNEQKLNFLKHTHSTYQNVRLGELITTVCLFTNFDLIYGSLGSTNMKNSSEFARGVQICPRIPVICGAYESYFHGECADNIRMLLPHSSRSQF